MSWLRLFRAQTAPATVLCVVLPYLLGGGNPKNLMILIPLFTLVHFLSFGHNSLMDYWYDIHDPNKKHHPLEKGEISLSTAHKVIHYGMMLCLTITIYVTYLISPKFDLALLALIMYFGWGHAYNDGLDKNTSHSWLSISLCFTSLAVYGWFLATNVFDSRLVLIAVWAFLTIFYQIAWEGNLKDLWNPSERMNLLRKLGVRLELWFERTEYKNGKAVKQVKIWRLKIPLWLDWFFFIIRVIINTVLILALSIIMLNEYYIVFLIAFIVFTVVEAITVLDLHLKVKEPFNRQRLLESFGVAEAFEFFRFMSLLYLTPSNWLMPILFFYGLIWFVGMNKLLWGSKFGPKV